jgi:hypothetical protein
LIIVGCMPLMQLLVIKDLYDWNAADRSQHCPTGEKEAGARRMLPHRDSAINGLVSECLIHKTSIEASRSSHRNHHGFARLAAGRM